MLKYQAYEYSWHKRNLIYLTLLTGTLCIPMWKWLSLTFVATFRSYCTASQVSWNVRRTVNLSQTQSNKKQMKLIYSRPIFNTSGKIEGIFYPPVGSRET